MELVSELIRLLKEYLSTKDEVLTNKIVQLLKRLAENTEERKILLKNTEKGIELFELLIQYVRHRYGSLFSLLQMTGGHKRQTMFSQKLVFESVIRASRFPVATPVSVFGITVHGLRNSLEKFRMKYAFTTVDFNRKMIKEVPFLLEYIQNKKKIIEANKKIILDRLQREYTVSDILDEIRYMDIAIRVSRVQALLKLLEEGKIKLNE